MFELKISISSDPEIGLFNQFQQAWEKIDPTKFKNGIANDDVKLKTVDGNNIIEFCTQLKKKHVRDDYKEFLELTLIFLGGCSYNIII